jgi:acyl dehydratase
MEKDSLITEEARALIGKEGEPITGEVYEKEIRRFCYAVGDLNPSYLDEEEHPTVLVHGPLQGAFLGQFMTDWISSEGTLKKIAYSNRGRVFPDEPFIMKGRITEKRIEGEQNLVECEIWGENKVGERVAVGSATVILPSRS